MSLLNRINGITLLLQSLDGINRVLVILPCDTLFCTQSRLMNLLVRRTATDTAEHDALNTHRVGRPKDSANIMLTAYVIQYHHDR